jgi:hypothetical protein
MPITSAINNFLPGAVFLLLAIAADVTLATDSAIWRANDTGVVRLEMADSSAYMLSVPEGVEDVFYDPAKHAVGHQHYVSVFQSSRSSPGNPSGYCGAGREVWLKVYRVDLTELVLRKSLLVSSCLHSISLASQGTGDDQQDTDFSSVQWSAQGVSIVWEGSQISTLHRLDDDPP